MSLRDAVQQTRAKQGLKSMQGKTTKGTHLRQSTRPTWADLEQVEETGGLIKFKVREGHHIYAPKKEVKEWEARNS